MLYYSSQINYGVCLYNMGPSYTEKAQENWKWCKEEQHVLLLGIIEPPVVLTRMLEDLQWTELQQCRKRAKVIMIYRIVNHLVAISPQAYLIPRGVALTTRGHDTRFLLPYSRIQSHQQSFFPSAIRLWTELPTAVVTASTLEGFKDSLQTVAIYQTCRF